MIRRANRFTISSKSRGSLGSDMAEMSRVCGVPLTIFNRMGWLRYFNHSSRL
jgi:hypothetical protein